MARAAWTEPEPDHTRETHTGAASTPARVAIVHDWLTGMRGGEKVLESICALYPAATVFTLVAAPCGQRPDRKKSDKNNQKNDRNGSAFDHKLGPIVVGIVEVPRAQQLDRLVDLVGVFKGAKAGPYKCLIAGHLTQHGHDPPPQILKGFICQQTLQGESARGQGDGCHKSREQCDHSAE